MKFFSGFSLGVFAPRLGKKTSCKADNQYQRKLTGQTLQSCFLECLGDDKCENVFVDYVHIHWMESPPPATCTLLGPIANPTASCAEESTGNHALYPVGVPVIIKSHRNA